MLHWVTTQALADRLFCAGQMGATVFNAVFSDRLPFRTSYRPKPGQGLYVFRAAQRKSSTDTSTQPTYHMHVLNACVAYPFFGSDTLHPACSCLLMSQTLLSVMPLMTACAQLLQVHCLQTCICFSCCDRVCAGWGGSRLVLLRLFS